LFDGKIWIKILLDNSIQKEELNELINNLSFFLEKKEQNKPSWVKIWHYRQLSDEEFTKSFNDVVKKFQNCEYDIPEHFIHVVALLIYFNKNKLCQLSVDKIKNQVNTCINNKYQNNQNWKNKLFENSIRFNGTGLGYMGEDDKNFQEILSNIKNKNKNIYNKEEINKQQKLLKQFLESIESLNEDFLTDLLLDKYRSIPIFNKLKSIEFVNILTNSENKNISKLREILDSRYGDYYCYLTDELDFWEKVNIQLNNFLENDKSNNSLKTFLLYQFNKYLIENIIENLKSCLKT
jgi:hypothetical protein